MSIRSKFKIRTRLRSVVRRIWPHIPKPLILMYHRIADEPVDFFSLAVAPNYFEQQLQVLRRTRHPLPLADFVRNLLAGTLRRDAVALTFDDGYADNLTAGKPRLAATDIPATVFLATGYLDRPGGIWSDELARLILLENGPQSFELLIRGESVHFDFGTELPAHANGTTPMELLLRRRTALSTLRQTLRILENEERESIMAELRSIFAGCDYRAKLGRAMTSKEVRTLVADGLITIGAHTVTHPVLPTLKPSACRREISESKAACEALTDAPVAGFAYPYGEFDARVREAVKASGFSYAASVQRGPVLPTYDVLALPRVHVSNWDGDTFERMLRSTS